MATKPENDLEYEVENEEAEDKPEIEIIDDTPEEDRGREPMPKEIVEEFEKDELEDYSEKVKIRLKQAKKLWHDERREKEREAREKAEALATAQRLLEENRKLKAMLSSGEVSLLDSYKQSANYEVEAAKRAYREAYELGDPDKIVEAQEKLVQATYKLNQLNSYKPTLQAEERVVDNYQELAKVPQIDPKTLAWQERNTWYGTDAEMTASALGLHQKLVQERGPQFAGTDEYWAIIDKTMRRRFPEYFGEEEAVGTNPASRESKAPTVVAPASRSRSSKKIVLKQSQLAIAKKLGLTPEQYARELMKIEN
jgi:hypothetical protein